VAYTAVLDADVLHPHISVDLLLRLAEHRVFQPRWSDEILAEVRGSLLRRGLDEARIDRRLGLMREHFPEASTKVGRRDLARVPDGVDSGDRHVAAAAFAARADGIVTRNVADFAADALERHGIEVLSLDAFLVGLWGLDPTAMITVLRELEADRTRPPRTVDELLAVLRPIAPTFVAQVEQRSRP
jgi:hypothetical protein